MTANVCLNLIAILALGVKSHSLQERTVPGKVLIVDHHVKKIFTRTVRNVLNAITDKTKLKFNLLC